MLTKLILHVTLMLSGLLSRPLEAQDDCTRWQLRRLDVAPGWYSKALATPPTCKETEVNDSLWRTNYRVSGDVTLVRFRGNPSYSTTFGDGVPGALYLCGRDTVLLDSSFGGYKNLSFNDDSTRCAAWETLDINSDYADGQIVMFELWNRSKKMVSMTVGASEVKFSTAGWLAYNDWADLWLCNPRDYSCELVFKRGGKYSLGCDEPMWRHISDISWAPDGSSVVFKYYPGRESETQYELYETFATDHTEEGDSATQK